MHSPLIAMSTSLPSATLSHSVVLAFFETHIETKYTRHHETQEEILAF